MNLLVTRDIDGLVIDYLVPVPAHRLVDVMRVEQLKPGTVLSADAIESGGSE